MNEVKVILVPGPGLSGIINLEANVGGNPGRLAWREVCAGDFGVGIAIGEFTTVYQQLATFLLLDCLTWPKFLEIIISVDSYEGRLVTHQCPYQRQGRSIRSLMVSLTTDLIIRAS